MSQYKLRIGIMASSSYQMCFAGAVGAIPLAMAHYGTSATFMQTVFALPSLASVPMSLMIGSLAQKTGKKVPLQLGILAMLASGLCIIGLNLPLAGFITAMVVMGLGLGSLMTLCTGILADHFEGAEQSKLMAQASAFANLGGMILAALGGVLLAFGWRQVFWPIAYAVPVIITNHFCLPKEDRPKAANKSKGKIKLNADVFILCGMVLVLGFCFGIRSANAGLLVAEHGLGAHAVANYAMSFWTAAGIVMGFIYGAVYKGVKRFMIPVFTALYAVGMVLMGCAGSTWVFYLGNAFAGMGIATAMPAIISRAVQSVDSESSTLAISLIFSSLNIAVFIAPAVVNTVAGLIGIETAQACFYIGAVSMAALSVGALFYIKD